MESRRVTEGGDKGKEERERSLRVHCIVSLTRKAVKDDGREMLDEGKTKLHFLLLHIPLFQAKEKERLSPFSVLQSVPL